MKVCHDRILGGAPERKSIRKGVHLALSQYALSNGSFQQCIDACLPHLTILFSCVRDILV